MSKELNEKKFFIVERIKYFHVTDTYSIHDNSMYDLTTAVRKMLALDTLNEKKDISYHLQEVSFSVVQEPLVLTKEMEVKETEQSEMPF